MPMVYVVLYSNDDYESNMGGSLMCISLVILFCGTVISSEGLKCFDCAEAFRTKYYDTDCQHRVNHTYLPRLCQPHERYCMVERSETNGVVTSFERNCAGECFWGCKFNGFGVTTKKCTSCCTHDGCNTGNDATKTSFQTITIFVQISCLAVMASLST